MKKKFLRALLLLLLGAAILTGVLLLTRFREKTEEVSSSLSKATLPVVELSYGENFISKLHGYLDEVDTGSLHPPIAPLEEKNRISVSIQTYGTNVDSVIYELRSIDGSRLIDDGEMKGWNEADGVMTKDLQLSNLMQDSTEYMLIFLVRTKNRTARYYSRVIRISEGNTDIMSDFIYEFTNATFTGNTGLIVNYIQPNDTMGTDDLSYINIHSRLNMFTWNGLNPLLNSDVITEISELTATQMTARLNYQVSITATSGVRYYNIVENYVVRYRNETRYLLYFDRTMTEVVSFSNMQFYNGNIWLGTTNSSAVSMDSPDGNIRVFVYQGQIWYYNRSDNSMILAFSYKDGDDERTTGEDSKIRLIRVLDDGSIDYLVYGYHVRGDHEGHVGASFCRYTPDNRVRELLYVPSVESEEVFEQQIGSLAYISDSELLYFLCGDTIYSADLVSGERLELARESSFVTNEKQSAVAWQEGTGQQLNEITAVNLEEGSLFRLHGNDGEFLQILGFIGNDLIYGVGRITDSGLVAGGGSLSPMYDVRIVTIAEELEETGNFSEEGVFVTGASISGNQISLDIVKKSEGIYVEAGQKQVFLVDQTDENTGNGLTSVQDSGFLKVNCLVLGIDPTSLVLTAKVNRYAETDGSEIFYVNAEDLSDKYFAYGLGRLLAIEDQLSLAIDDVYSVMGLVTDYKQNIVWARDTRALSVGINVDDVVAALDGSVGSSMEQGLRILLASEKITLNGDLSSDETDPEAAALAIGNAGLLNLNGCAVSRVLYYLNLGHIILAMTGENTAMLIVGYETNSVTLYDPAVNEYSLMSLSDAEANFSALGYRFYCYFSN